jgi:hypothetical protein
MLVGWLVGWGPHIASASAVCPAARERAAASRSSYACSRIAAGPPAATGRPPWPDAA